MNIYNSIYILYIHICSYIHCIYIYVIFYLQISGHCSTRHMQFNLRWYSIANMMAVMGMGMVYRYGHDIDAHGWCALATASYTFFYSDSYTHRYFRFLLRSCHMYIYVYIYIFFHIYVYIWFCIYFVYIHIYSYIHCTHRLVAIVLPVIFNSILADRASLTWWQWWGWGWSTASVRMSTLTAGVLWRQRSGWGPQKRATLRTLDVVNK